MEGPDDEQPTAQQKLEAFVDQRVQTVIQDVEIRIGQKVEQTAREIGTALKPLVDAAIAAALPEVVKQIGEQFEAKMKGQPGSENSADRAGAEAGKGNRLTGGIDSFLARAGPADILEIINAWRQPSSDAQLAGVFKTFIQGMSFGQKMKVGELTPKDMEDALGLTIGAQEAGKETAK